MSHVLPSTDVLPDGTGSNRTCCMLENGVTYSLSLLPTALDGLDFSDLLKYVRKHDNSCMFISDMQWFTLAA